MKWNASHVPKLEPRTIIALEKVITLLLEKGARVNSPSGDMGTPLQLAVLIGCKELVRRMLDAGTDVNAPGPGGKMFANALQAAEKGGHVEVTEMLKEAGGLDIALTKDKETSGSFITEYTSEEDEKLV